MVTAVGVRFDSSDTPYWYYVAPSSDVDLSVGDRIKFVDNRKVLRGPATVVAIQYTNDFHTLPFPPNKMILSAEKIEVNLEVTGSTRNRRRLCASVDHAVFNGPATIVFFKDGKKEISKISKDDVKVADPRVGFCITYLKHVLPEVMWKKEILPILNTLTDRLSDDLIDPTDMSLFISLSE